MIVSNKLLQEIKKTRSKIILINNELRTLSNEADGLFPEYRDSKASLENMSPATSGDMREYQGAIESYKKTVISARQRLMSVFSLLSGLETGPESRRVIEKTAVNVIIDNRLKNFFYGLAGLRTVGVIQTLINFYPVIPQSFKRQAKGTVVEQLITTSPVILASMSYLNSNFNGYLTGRGITFNTDFFFDTNVTGWKKGIIQKKQSMGMKSKSYQEMADRFMKVKENARSIGARRGGLEQALVKLQGMLAIMEQKWNQKIVMQQEAERRSNEIAIRQEKLEEKKRQAEVKRWRAIAKKTETQSGKRGRRESIAWNQSFNGFTNQVQGTPDFSGVGLRRHNR